MSRLSVIIPTLNEAQTVPRLLDALSAQTRPPDEVIVADAGSTDGTADVARVPGSGSPPRAVIDIAQLREQLGRFENPIPRLSAAGLDQLDSLFHRDWKDGDEAKESD